MVRSNRRLGRFGLSAPLSWLSAVRTPSRRFAIALACCLVSVSVVIAIVSLERPRPEPNRALLDEIARATGGRVEPKAGEIPPITGPAKREPLTPWLLLAALVLFLIELIVRRARGAAIPARPLAKAA